MDGLRQAMLAGGLGLGMGVLYALLAQALFRARSLAPYLNAMSRGFLFGVPVALGLLTTSVALTRHLLPVAVALALPAVACLLVIALLLTLRREPPLPLLMALPLCLGAASLGGTLGTLLVRTGTPREALLGIVGMGLLAPFALAVIEQRRRAVVRRNKRCASITIAAESATIWRNIIRVPPIGARERRSGLFTLVGIPRPCEATLSHEGLGGIRTGLFERGITFRETIVGWQEGRALRFTFEVDRSAPVPAPLGAIGGPHFAIEDVAYRLETLPDGRTCLHLTCRDCIATPVNGYANLWLGAIMGDFQRSILRVVKTRCEAGAPGTQTNAPAEVLSGRTSGYCIAVAAPSGWRSGSA